MSIRDGLGQALGAFDAASDVFPGQIRAREVREALVSGIRTVGRSRISPFAFKGGIRGSWTT